MDNAEFQCGKAEDILPTLMHRFSDPLDRVIVVVDPPRAGLRELWAPFSLVSSRPQGCRDVLRGCLDDAFHLSQALDSPDIIVLQ